MDKAIIQETLNVLRKILKQESDRVIQSIESSNKTSKEAILSLKTEDRTGELLTAIDNKEQENVLEAGEINESIQSIENDVNIEAPQINIDTDNILRGLKQVSLDIKAIRFPSIPETEKTRDLLVEIANRIEKTDLSRLESLVEGIKLDFPSNLDVNLDPNLIEDGYLKVRQDQKQVDQMSVLIDSSGANGANVSNKLEEVKIEIGKLTGFEIGNYDDIELTYVATGNGEGEIETATYKDGATTKAVLTLAYDASNRLINVSKS